MDKNIANKVLGWLKIILKDPPVENTDMYDNLYSTMSVPQPIKSLGYEDEFIISLIKNNLEDFYECGKMGDKVIIDAMGQEFCLNYINFKKQEWNEYHDTVSRWELDKYLTLF